MYQEKEIFFYGYKVQGKCSGFCDLLLKNDFFLLLIYHNISIEISIWKKNKWKFRKWKNNDKS
jgi:hypothetical protein